MALYLEADRMSSFKVTDADLPDRAQSRRRGMAHPAEPALRQPRTEDLYKTVFTTHSYRWTPIGNMQQLLAAPGADLQDFFNTYYVPNNAVLVIAGDVDVEAAKELVQKYYAWIPTGTPVPHPNSNEPEQTKPREPPPPIASPS